MGFIEMQTIMAGLLFDCITPELKAFTPLHVNQRGDFPSWLWRLEGLLSVVKLPSHFVVSCFTSTFNFNALTLFFWHPNWETHACFLVDLSLPLVLLPDFKQIL
jgi:hypothetical protein